MDKGTVYLLLVGFSLVAGLAVAWFIGRKRRIGFGWTLFFSVFLTPVVALIFVVVSPRPYELARRNKVDDQVSGAIVFLLCSVYEIIASKWADPSLTGSLSWVRCYFIIGPVGLIIYMLMRIKRNRRLYDQTVAAAHA